MRQKGDDGRTGESDLLSPPQYNPPQASPRGLFPFPQILSQASPIVYAKTPGSPPDPTSGLLCGSLLHSTTDLQGCRNSGVPTVPVHTKVSPLTPDRGQAKDWRYNGAGLRFGDTSVGSTLEKEATTDGGLPSQLLLCPISPGLRFHSISLCLGIVQDVNHSRISVL